jgi:hypothetical protein
MEAVQNVGSEPEKKPWVEVQKFWKTVGKSLHEHTLNIAIIAVE